MRRLQATFVCAVLVRRCRGCTPRKLIVDAGPAAVARVLEFFAARIANRRTRAAYSAGRGAVSGLVPGARAGARVSPAPRPWAEDTVAEFDGAGGRATLAAR